MVQRGALCRSRRELSNEYLLDEIGVDTAENEPLEVWRENSIQYSFASLHLSRTCRREKEPDGEWVLKFERHMRTHLVKSQDIW